MQMGIDSQTARKMAMSEEKSPMIHETDDAAAIDRLDDKIAATAFRRLVAHLRHRTDAQNVDLMGLAGFCRNCLADWVRDADAAQGGTMDKASARALIYGMPQDEWKAKYQTEASPEQIAKMNESIAKNDH
jgi:hypothetical protein